MDPHTAMTWRRVLRLAWGVLAVPACLVLFALLLALMFPFGGGIAHLMFAYSPGGSLGGARIAFVGHALATMFITGFLRWTHYPAPWYARAGLASVIALWIWAPWAYSEAVSPAFRVQAWLLAPLLPGIAFSIAAWGRPRASRALAI